MEHLCHLPHLLCFPHLLDIHSCLLTNNGPTLHDIETRLRVPDTKGVIGMDIAKPGSQDEMRMFGVIGIIIVIMIDNFQSMCGIKNCTLLSSRKLTTSNSSRWNHQP